MNKILTASLSHATISPYDTWLHIQYRGSFGSYDQSSLFASTTRPFSPSTMDGDSGSVPDKIGGVDWLGVVCEFKLTCDVTGGCGVVPFDGIFKPGTFLKMQKMENKRNKNVISNDIR